MEKEIKARLNKAIGELLVFEITEAITNGTKGQRRAKLIEDVSNAIGEATKDGDE